MIMFLRDLMDRFDQLSLRERIIVLIATLLLVAYVWDQFFMFPLDKERKGRLQQIEALRAEVTGLESSIETLVAQTVKLAVTDREQLELAGEPLSAQLASINDEVATLEATLEGDDGR